MKRTEYSEFIEKIKCSDSFRAEMEKKLSAVPKEKIAAIMQVLGDVSVTAPVSAGDVIVPDVLGTGADIIATRSVAATHL